MTANPNKQIAGPKGRGGRPPYKKKPSKDDLCRLYEAEERSVREIADLLGCSKDIVFRCLKEYDIKARPNARRSNLRQYELQVLEEGIKAKGLRGFARELRVDSSTLLHHVRLRKGKR
jgi:hypothetical protein